MHLEVHPKATVENKSYYRKDIDGLRGIAVSLVVLYHLFPGVFKNGFLGVDVFFVISGFVVTQALQRNLRHGHGLINFYAHRIKRILPALYFSIIVTITLSCLFIPQSDLKSIFKTATVAIVGASNIGLLYARFDYFSPDLSLNPFVHTWSLGVEEQFYLLFPSAFMLGSYLAAKRKRFKVGKLLGIIFFLSLLYWVYLLFKAPMSAFYNPLARFWELLIGAILCVNKNAIASFTNTRNSALFQYLAVGLLVTALLLSSNNIPLNQLANIFVVLATALSIAIGIATPTGLNDILGSKLPVWIGRLSYSLYLWHYPIFTFMQWNSDLHNPLYATLALLLTLLISFFSYRYIEIPFRYASIKGVSVIFRGAGAVAVSLLLVYILYQLPPSRIFLGKADHYNNLWPAAGAPLTVSLTATQRDCHLEYLDKLSPDRFKLCTTKNMEKNFIYLIGNSHAQHLIPMIESASRKLGYGYTALTISNCRMISAFQVISSINYRYDLCKDYFDYSTDYVIKNSKPGDIVLFGARSLLDKPSPSEMNYPSNIYLDDKQFTAKESYEKSISDLSEFSNVLQSKGVYLVFAGPTPQFSLTATQCPHEWFRLNKDDCKVPLQSLLAEKASYSASISEINKTSNNGHLWDPSAILCDGTYCYQARGDKLLFRDKHHLSVYGSEALAPSFVDFINGIKTQSKGDKHD